MTDETGTAGGVPTESEDRERIAAAEAHLEDVERHIEQARATHEEAGRHTLDGRIPGTEGDEGEGNANTLQA